MIFFSLISLVKCNIKDKKLDEIKKRAIANAEDEANAEFSNRNIETNEIKRILLNINLKLHEIPPDGDCLYNALSYQINKGREVYINNNFLK